MAIRLFVGALWLMASLPGFTQSQEMAITALIDALREQGYSILYSNSFVFPSQRVQVDGVSMQALERALVPLQLQVQLRDGVWVISQGELQEEGASNVEAATVPTEIMENIIITGSRYRFPSEGTASSARSFTPEDIAVVPTLASDAMRVALGLPGVSSVGVSAKPRIRGGLQDELLVMQDGVELLEPFHLADYHSAYSTIDYHTIESLDIYTGGFPSRYGNRMSGVIDIRNDWQEREYNTDLGVSSFANFINTRGQFGRERPVNWLLSVRNGDLSDLTDYIETRSGDPTYFDASARLNIALSDKTTVAIGAVYGEDDVVFEDDEEHASSQIKSRYIWTAVDWQPSPSLAGSVTLSWLDISREKRQGSVEDEDEDEEKGGFLDYRADIQRFALRNDFSATVAGQFLEFGWQAEYNSGEYRDRSVFDRGVLADILDTQREVDRDIHLEPDGWSGGAYGQIEWQLTPRLIIQPSLRLDYQNYYLERSSEYQLSPRIGVAYELNDETGLRLSVGRFSQPEGIAELQVRDGVTQFFSPQQSDQVIAGVEWQRDDLQFVGELYYKRYDDQKGRFENMFNPFVLLPEMEPDRVGIYPQKAVARGMDLDAQYQFSAPLSGHLRYSYMDADDRLNGKWVPRRWSQQHTAKAGLVWQKESVSFSLALTWHSGWRSSQLPAIVPEGTVIPIEDVLNNTELKDYFSLDVSARKSWKFRAVQLQIYADISNLTDRSNAAGIDYDVEEEGDAILLIPDHETLLKRVPSVGITLSF